MDEKEEIMENILHQIQEDKQLQYQYEVKKLYHGFFYRMMGIVRETETLTQKDVQREIMMLLETRKYLAMNYLHP